MGSITTRESELLFSNIFIFSLWYPGKSLAFGVQCLEKFSEKWLYENTRFPLPTLLCATRCEQELNVKTPHSDFDFSSPLSA